MVDAAWQAAENSDTICVCILERFFPDVVLNPRNDNFWSYGISECSFLSQGLAGLQAIDVPGIENVSSNLEPCAFLSWYPECNYLNDYVHRNYCLKYNGRLNESTSILRKEKGGDIKSGHIVPSTPQNWYCLKIHGLKRWPSCNCYGVGIWEHAQTLESLLSNSVSLLLCNLLTHFSLMKGCVFSKLTSYVNFQVNLTEMVNGHSSYLTNVQDILQGINIDSFYAREPDKLHPFHTNKPSSTAAGPSSSA